MKKNIKNLFFVVFVFLISNTAGMGADEVHPPVLLRLEGTVNPVIAEHIQKELENPDASFVLLRMDTPGGLMDSMRQIVRAIEGCPVPVVVYVGEAGARAASAGTFILMASDVAVMARGTNVGAAHPVGLGGGEEQGTGKKAVEDARAFIKSLAEKHSRNYEWAQKAVTESSSITAQEAREVNVIDFLVEDFSHLKEKLEGVEVEKQGVLFTLSFSREFNQPGMSFIRKFLNYLAHPNLAYILLILGIYGLIFEVANPGVGFGAVLGGMSLLLAALALQIIPVNIVGVLLIVLGAILMLTDVWVPSEGILTIGGVISFAMGSFILFDVTDFPLRVAPSLIIGATITVGAFFMFAAGAGLRIQKKAVFTGKEGMVGLDGEVIDKLAPEGKVYVRGEIWSALSNSGTIEKNKKVVVEQIEGNVLRVAEKEEEV
ncbi:MAG: NfeD family protein [Elusimicrobiota bacterium]